MFDRLCRLVPETHRQFVTFCAIGVIGFVVDNGVLSLMVRVVGASPLWGRVVSILIAMTGSWLLNRTLTFRRRRSQPLWVEYLRFCTANAVGNTMNFLVFLALVREVALFGRIPELATVVGTAVGLAFNFTLSKYFVFQRS